MLIVLGASGFSSPAFGLPKGAVKLTADKTFTVGSTACGKIGSKWLPGTILNSRGYFVTHTQQSKNYRAEANGATGKKKHSLLAKAKQFSESAKSEAATCASGPPVPLKFGLTNAVGLVLQDVSASRLGTAGLRALGASSNLKTVGTTGELQEAAVSGSATLQRLLIAPSKKVYVAFTDKTNIDNTTLPGSCLLAEVDATSGQTTCVDGDLSYVTWFDDDLRRNRSIQFDASGSLYYMGNTTPDLTQLVLRKYSNGSRTDIVSGNMQIYDYLVLPDGSVLLSGSTNSTGALWARRITPAGAVQTLVTGEITFFNLFPDGNVYFNLTEGFMRYLTSANQIESKAWIAWRPTDAYFYVDDFDCSNNAQLLGFCNMRLPQASYRTSNDHIFVIAGAGTARSFMQYYPTVATTSTAVHKVTVAQAGSDPTMILAGLDGANTNVLTSYNTADGTETQLLGAANETEIYHLNYLAASNVVMFDGLRFSDNTYVLGICDLNTMACTEAPTGSSKLADFQTFN
jgi:hypothetical protein